MDSNSGNSMIDRVIAWLRGFFNRGSKQLNRGGQRPGDHQRRGFTQEDARSAGADRASRDIDEATGASGRDTLLDLDATESGYAYTGEPSDATHPPAQAGTGGPASEAADRIEAYQAERSDLDDAGGSADADDTFLPPDSTDPNEVYHLHDAVGGERASAEDDGTDSPIDTERDTELASQHGNGGTELNGAIADAAQDRDIPGGASQDEFAHGGYEPAQVDQEDVESAAEGRPAEMEDDPSTSDVGDLEQHADAGSSPRTIQDFNYGAGDLGVGQADLGEGRAETGTERTDLSGTEEATREEIERTNRGDAFTQGDEAVTAPGQSEPEAFGDVTTGTTEPSRSATGNDLEEGPDALGTTLDHTEESSETFEPDEANLSSEEEMSVSDLEAGEQPGSVSGEDSSRVTTFQSGTIAREGVGSHTGAQDEVDTPEQPYAGIPDEPGVTPSEEETEHDDFSGSDYPSDRRIDRLAGDDPFEGQKPDIGAVGSSAGDLPTSAAGQDDLLISEEPPAAAADPGTAEGTVLDQDVVAEVDDSVGDAPGTIDLATGAAAGMAFADEDAPGADDPGPQGDATTIQQAERDDSQAAPQAIADDGGAGSASTEDGDLPAGAVRGDGTTSTPEGYPVKGNASSKIYHLPSFPSYGSTKPEFCFATEQDAIDAGYRAPGRRNRGRKK